MRRQNHAGEDDAGDGEGRWLIGEKRSGEVGLREKEQRRVQRERG